MSDLIDDLHIIVRVLTEDGYPSKYADSIVNAINTLKQQTNRIKELEGYSILEDVDCFCE